MTRRFGWAEEEACSGGSEARGLLEWTAADAKHLCASRDGDGDRNSWSSRGRGGELALSGEPAEVHVGKPDNPARSLGAHPGTEEQKGVLRGRHLCPPFLLDRVHHGEVPSCNGRSRRKRARHRGCNQAGTLFRD
ncbi:hypothetical protein HNY73_001553 [Argiope bruennichi]|uniref:Uncharacterized protein n=1 Tax=Argiope bruennichi TaxID=94029 RepID=A0A8T0G462_ARGBR|nr:hypothetical protein HNY73_001553 [Argiope bruennichi]